MASVLAKSTMQETRENQLNGVHSKLSNHKSAAEKSANQNDAASSVMLETDILLDDGEGSDTYSLDDVAEWALDSQKRNQKATAGKARSYSVQLNTHPKLITETADLSTRRASTAVGGRDSAYNIDRDTGSRPVSGAADRRRSMYGNTEGVKLRGDKGKASRKQSAHSASSRTNQLNSPITNEWKRSFIIPYTPRTKATKLVNATIPPPKIEHLDTEEHEANLKQHRLNRLSLHHRKEQSYKHAGKYHRHVPKSKHVEIHYEDFLPRESWLEMKPKQFTRNHKHGNHFEFRKQEEKTSIIPDSSLSGQTRKEAYVWENPYQIWLMEKTHND